LLSSSGSLAIFAAIRRAWSLVSSLATAQAEGVAEKGNNLVPVGSFVGGAVSLGGGVFGA